MDNLHLKITLRINDVKAKKKNNNNNNNFINVL